jgi:hypothetical protein
MVEWRKNQLFEDHLRPRPHGTVVVGFFAIQPLDAAGSQRRFYYSIYLIVLFILLLVWKCCFMDKIMADESEFTIKEQVVISM